MLKLKKPKLKRIGNIDITFFILVLILLTFGLVMLFSASYAYAYYYFNNSFHFIQRQAIFAVLGVGAMILLSYLDYRILKKFVYWIFGLTLLLLVVVLAMPELNNARRWISLGPITIQPSELMKFAIVILFAYLISKNYKKMGTFKFGVLPFMLVLGVIAVLMLLQPHLSGTILIGSIGMIMMFVGGTKYRYFFITLGVAVIGLIAIVSLLGVDYVADRLAGWIDPFSDPSDSTFQTVQSLLAIGSGGIMGLGLGNSRQKYLYLPEPQNDFIFSILVEELGFIGAAVVIILFVMLVYRGFVIASKSRDIFGMMITVGLTVQIGLQALLNIAVVTNTIPNTGISLPFFSSGGTALMMQLAQMGIILNVSRHCVYEKV